MTDSSQVCYKISNQRFVLPDQCILLPPPLTVMLIVKTVSSLKKVYVCLVYVIVHVIYVLHNKVITGIKCAKIVPVITIVTRVPPSDFLNNNNNNTNNNNLTLLNLQTSVMHYGMMSVVLPAVRASLRLK